MRLVDKSRLAKLIKIVNKKEQTTSITLMDHLCLIKIIKRAISCHKLSLQAGMLYPCATMPTKVEKNYSCTGSQLLLLLDIQPSTSYKSTFLVIQPSTSYKSTFLIIKHELRSCKVHVPAAVVEFKLFFALLRTTHWGTVLSYSINAIMIWCD